STALCSDGTVAAWGWNGFGQLGNDTMYDSTDVPIAVNTSGVLSNKTVVSLASGCNQHLALCSDGTVVEWGYGRGDECGAVDSDPLALQNPNRRAGERRSRRATGNTWAHSPASVPTAAVPNRRATQRPSSLSDTGAMLRGALNAEGCHSRVPS